MRTALTWTPREPPLAPAAVTAPVGRSAALIEAVRRRVDAGAELRVVAGDGRLVVLGEPGELPWCLDAVYLGWDRGLLVPTTLVPSLPPDLLLAAATRLVVPEGAPVHRLIAILPDALIAAPVPIRPVDVDQLGALVGGRR
jgi:hypothetical protein